MKEYISLFTESVLSSLESFERLVTNKPFVSVLFPSSGLGSLYIPDTIASIGSPDEPILQFIEALTPYLKFVFLLLTIVLTIASAILQIRKLLSKNDKE